MTEQETSKAIMYIRSIKPSAFAFLDDEIKVMTVMAWYRKLHTYSLNTVIDAIDSYYENPEHRRGTNPPMPDDIKDLIMTERNPELSVNLDESFSLVNKKILQISPTPLYADGVPISPEDRMRERMSELEWETISMMGGHKRFRDASESEMPFLRREYKEILNSLINQAKHGNFIPKYDDQPTLEEMNQAALDAQERGIDTTKFRAMIQGMIKR